MFQPMTAVGKRLHCVPQSAGTCDLKNQLCFFAEYRNLDLFTQICSQCIVQKKKSSISSFVRDTRKCGANKGVNFNSEYFDRQKTRGQKECNALGLSNNGVHNADTIGNCAVAVIFFLFF